MIAAKWLDRVIARALAAGAALGVAAGVAGVAAVLLRGGADVSPLGRMLATPALSTALGWTLATLAVTAPAGLMAALWQTRYAGEGALARVLRGALQGLGAIPSLVYGLAALMLPPGGAARWWYGLALLVAMALPWSWRWCVDALAEVPLDLEEASRALGATEAQTLGMVTFPLAARGLAAAALRVGGRVFAVSALVAALPLRGVALDAPVDALRGACVWVLGVSLATTLAARLLRTATE